MIESFFQNLNSTGTEYLLISGQATVLYGAATFSEDIDLWVNPNAANAERFLNNLRGCGARYYKLTPGWELQSLRGGHGFHFLLRPADGADVYLDVMGAPPRVRSFSDAVKEAQWLDTDWGKVHVIGIHELVELKKTQRLADYPIIGRLALAWLNELDRPTRADYEWALRHIFTLPELDQLIEAHPAAAEAVSDTVPSCVRAYIADLRGGPSDELESEVAGWLQGRITELQNADRRYWRRIIRELKDLRKQGRLMPEGQPV